jgi:hypothetical protein
MHREELPQEKRCFDKKETKRGHRFIVVAMFRRPRFAL